MSSRWYTTTVDIGKVSIEHRFPVGGMVRDRRTQAQWMITGVHYVIGAGRYYHLDPVNDIAREEAAVTPSWRRFIGSTLGESVRRNANDVERDCELLDEQG